MSLVAPLQTACLVAFALLLVLAAWQDLRTMRIADAVSLAVVPVFAVWALSGVVLGTVSFAMIGLALACAAGVFGLGAIAFAIGVLGGGDVKLLAASSLFAGTALMPDFLMVTSLAGATGPSGAPARTASPSTPPAGHATTRLRLRGGLPYGPAIAAGGLWVAGSLALQ
jgi:prepilin peptidase CpaA